MYTVARVLQEILPGASAKPVKRNSARALRFSRSRETRAERKPTTVATSYNEIENLKLALYFVLKLSVTTGFIFGPIVVYAVSKLAKAERVSTQTHTTQPTV